MGLRFVSKLGDRLKVAKDNPSKTFNIDTEPDPFIRIDGDIWVFSGDTTGQAKENGFLLWENETVNIAAGVLVSGYAEPATRKRTPSLHTLSVSVGGL